MKFLFVIDNLGTGGSQRQMVNLAVGLKQRGYTVEFFCYSKGNQFASPLQEAAIPVHWFQKKGRFSPAVIFELRRVIRQGNYDLLLSFLATPNFYSLVARWISGKRRLPVIVSERSADWAGWVGRSELIARQFYRFASVVVTNSHHQRITLSNRYPFLRGKLRTIYNGYDLDYFHPPENEPANDPLRLLVIASVSHFKNGLCLIEALRILRDRYHILPRLDWIGQRVMVGHRYAALQEMEKYISDYHLDGQWRWLGQRTDIVEQYHAHDILIHPSYVEGLPNVVCEGLACGRPVIISNALDHPRLVQDGVSGFLFDYTSAEHLAEKIRILNEMPTVERHRMGLAGRSFAEKELGLGRYVDEFETLILDKTKGGQR